MSRKILLATTLILGLFACDLEKNEVTKIKITGLSEYAGRYATVELSTPSIVPTKAALSYPSVSIPSSGTVEISMVAYLSRKPWYKTGTYHAALLIYSDNKNENLSWRGDKYNASITSVTTFDYSEFTMVSSASSDIGALAGEALKNIAQFE